LRDGAELGTVRLLRYPKAEAAAAVPDVGIGAHSGEARAAVAPWTRRGRAVDWRE